MSRKALSSILTDFISSIKERLEGKPLPKDVIFIEKPSFLVVVGVYIIGIIVLILIWKINENIFPNIIMQIVNFFKGLKYEWVESVFSTIVGFIYILILIFVFGYQIKRETTIYKLTEKEIIIKKGVFVKEEIYLPLIKVRNVSCRVSLIGYILKYGTITVDTGGLKGLVSLVNITEPQKKIRQILNLLEKYKD
jgi:uncharacterized membrane protein YdbT with pleckstrin-like domain